MKKVIMYTKDYCPYCHRAKALLDVKGVKYEEIDFFTLSEDKQRALFDKTEGYTSVPQIFIGDEFIGGFDQLHALEVSGKLDDKLA